jgi:Recombination endonuclease VII
MPISKDLKRFYGAEWRAYRAALIAVHGSRCSRCHRLVRKYLNLAHIDHDQRGGRVALLCMACHNRHDARYRLATWRRNRSRREGQLWLLPELEYAPFPAWRVPAAVRKHEEHSRQSLLFP